MKKIKEEKKKEEEFKKRKTTEGGLSGLENTGYDEDSMNAYIKADNMNVQTNSDDFDVEQYKVLLMDHRNKVLLENL